jgi:Tfp pilus assembly protein PilO
MELDDLRDRYKLLPMAARIGVAVVVGVLPILYIFLDEGATLSDHLTELQERESQIRTKFEKARDRKGNLPKLEETLAFTEEQLNKAKRMLPETFRIEDVLQKVATTARDVGVKLESFKPLEEVKKDLGYPTVEIPIQAEIAGRFGDIGNFLDQILRGEMGLFIKSIAITPVNGEATPLAGQSSTKSEFTIAKEARQQATEKAVLTIVAYRSQTQMELTEQQAIDSSIESSQQGKSNNSKKSDSSEKSGASPGGREG